MKPFCLWMTGLPSSGKSTISHLLAKRFRQDNHNCYILDGDVVRTGLCSDLKFSAADREENLRRIAEVSTILVNAGIITIVACISPTEASRNFARELFQSGQFLELYVKCPLAVCIQRDPKGNYEKALKGIIPDFTGIGSPYEEPANSEIVVDTNEMMTVESIDHVYNMVLHYMK